MRFIVEKKGLSLGKIQLSKETPPRPGLAPTALFQKKMRPYEIVFLVRCRLSQALRRREPVGRPRPMLRGRGPRELGPWRPRPALADET